MGLKGRHRYAAIAGGAALVASAVLSAASGPSPTSTPAEPVHAVGRPTTFASARSGSPTTRLPAGSRPGDVLVTYLDTGGSSAAVKCPERSKRVVDRADRHRTRLVVCVTLVTTAVRNVSVQVSPPSQVSMLTEAFSGVDTGRPVAGGGVSASRTSPSVPRVRAGDEVVYGEASGGHRARAARVSGRRPAATASDGRTSQVAVAHAAVSSSGVSRRALWSISPAPVDPVSASVVLSALGGPAPSVPPAQVCGDTALLAGPARAPAGAVTIPAGVDDGLYDRPRTTYWLAPGLHTLGRRHYDQIAPGRDDTYIGAPGAVLDGEGADEYAISGSAAGVTVEHLTIKGFVPPGAEAAVNENGAPDWTIEDDTITDNSPGAGAMLGTNNVLTGDCLSRNGQYGFQAYSTWDASSLTGGPSNVTVTDNEIAGNDTYDWEVRDPGCGCSGGAKFWRVDGATVEDNYVVGNRNVGLWADTDNTGFTIVGNYIAGNYNEGLVYEISYNALIADNTFVDDAVGGGKASLGVLPALYVSESGGDDRVPGANSGLLNITGNVFTDDWGGINLAENSNRFCSDGYDEVCTLVDPSVYTIKSCGANLPTAKPDGNPDYFDGCRWKTQNVLVDDNTFDFDPSLVGPSCTLSHGCGVNGLFSEYGSVAPYQAWVVPLDITDRQDNVFEDNTYIGPWAFDAFALGDTVTWSRWRRGFANNGSGSFFVHGQDAASTYDW